jgi:hypothetical protein
MTVYATPSSTPQQTTGFQGTAPGNAAIGALVSPITPGVGLFVPNSNTASGASVLSEQSKGNLIANALITNAGKHAAGGRTLQEAQAHGGTRGYNGSAGGYDSLNSDANGGSGPGAGQANQTEGPSSGESSFVEGAAPATAPTVTSPAQYGG